MTTTFQSMYGYLHAILGDNDSDAYRYSDDLFNQYIRLVILSLADPTYEESGDDPPSFTLDLTTTQKAIFVYQTAKAILAPAAGDFSYITPVLSVRRSHASAVLLALIEETLERLLGGALALQEDNELWAHLNEYVRLTNDYAQVPTL